MILRFLTLTVILLATFPAEPETSTYAVFTDTPSAGTSHPYFLPLTAPARRPNGPTDLVINELMADNENTLADPADGAYDDWFEIYNPTTEEVDLQGLYLTDQLISPTKHLITQSLTVPAGGYLLFWADDEADQGANHVSFKLSADGEEIALFDSDGVTPIDAHTFYTQTADVSRGRFPDGADNWLFFNAPTPGSANLLNPPVISDTTRTPLLPTASDVVTVKATITDDGLVVTATLYYSAAGSSFVAVPMNSLGDDLYAASIPLQSNGQRVAYYLLAGDDDGQTRSDPPDAPESVYAYVVGYRPPTLFVNEFLADNQAGLTDPDEPDETPDWIELYNPGPGAVDLGGKYLSDDPDEPTRFRIADGVSIPEGGFVLFYADNDPEQGPFHTNFALDPDGESVGLYDSDVGGNLPLDTHTFYTQTTDVSQGRCPDGAKEWLFFKIPTPGAPNGPCSALPIISQVGHTPPFPTASDPVTVTATITDDGTIVSATVWYGGGGTAFIPLPMDPAGDDRYSATLPPRPDGTWVPYFIQAEDDASAVAIDPPDAPAYTYGYLVGYQPPTVYLNEFLADNRAGLSDPDEADEFPDWIELHNPGPEPVALGGFYLTDDLSDPTQFRITDSITVAAGGFVLFYADSDPEQGPFHTNFRLDADGEAVGLFAPGTLPIQIDAVRFGPQTTDVAWGRLPDGTGAWQTLRCPTPGQPNAECRRVYLPLVVKGR